MKNYGKVQSLNQPQEIEIKEEKVFLASNIQPYTTVVEDKEESGYEYDYVEYSKDEYIKLLSQQSQRLEEELAAAKVLLGVE